MKNFSFLFSVAKGITTILFILTFKNWQNKKFNLNRQRIVKRGNRKYLPFIIRVAVIRLLFQFLPLAFVCKMKPSILIIDSFFSRQIIFFSIFSFFQFQIARAHQPIFLLFAVQMFFSGFLWLHAIYTSPSIRVIQFFMLIYIEKKN